MSIYHYAHSLMTQMFQNLDEADWASRHVKEAGSDCPAPAKLVTEEVGFSSLSLALQKMGLVSRSSQAAGIDFEA